MPAAWRSRLVLQWHRKSFLPCAGMVHLHLPGEGCLAVAVLRGRGRCTLCSCPYTAAPS